MQEHLKVISSVLYHDRKINTYKFALIRAIADVSIAYSYDTSNQVVTIPLEHLAYKWIAYYWPFMSDGKVNGVRQGSNKTDVVFRRELEALKAQFLTDTGNIKTSFIDGGFNFSNKSDDHFHKYKNMLKIVLSKIKDGLKQPIKYSGTDLFKTEKGNLIIPTELFKAISLNSLYIEALAIAEWAKYLGKCNYLNVGKAYTILTQIPEARQSISRYREIFTVTGVLCPYCHKPITEGTNRSLELDHVVPVAVHPINDLWNLWPSDRKCNGGGGKSDKIPSKTVLIDSKTYVKDNYERYLDSKYSDLFRSQMQIRLQVDQFKDLNSVTDKVINFIDHIAEVRNVNRWAPSA